MKKGASHIEFILSFVIFIAAVSTVIFLFNPIRTNTDDSALYYGFREIERNTSMTISEYTLSLEAIPNGENIFCLELTGESPTSNISVETYTGERLRAVRSGDKVCIQQIDTENYVILRFGEGFDNYGDIEVNGQPNLYVVASHVNRVLASERKVVEMNKTYYGNYSELKRRFNLPNNADFDFELTFGDGLKIEAVKEVPTNTEIFADIKRIEIMRSNGDIEFADLKVRVW